MDVPQQRAAVIGRSTLRTPDWSSVARSYDAVHLSWAGYITSEGYVSQVADGLVTMLRYWFTERAHWLHDRFGEPVPLGAPSVTGVINGDFGISCLLDDQRRESDLKRLESILGRSSVT